jgi:tripartite ATP-independent transporter DctM subunit
VVGVPVTDLYAGALVPGVMLAGIYALYALARCYMNPSLGPALPEEEHADSKTELLVEFLKGMVPITVLLVASLGTIMAGVATPTEGAALGAVGAFVLTLAYRRLTWALFYNSTIKTLEVSCMILFLVAASNFYGGVFSRLGTPEVLSQALLGLQLPPFLILVIIMAAIFLLAWPLEWVPIVLIFVPIVLPMVKQLGIDITWFSILVAVNLQTAWLSPPVALSAYFLKGVAPQWQLSDIYKGMMQFMVLQVIGLALVMVFPQIALWLPGVLYTR